MGPQIRTYCAIISVFEEIGPADAVAAGAGAPAAPQIVESSTGRFLVDFYVS
jgi:hypothetical protein